MSLFPKKVESEVHKKYFGTSKELLKSIQCNKNLNHNLFLYCIIQKGS